MYVTTHNHSPITGSQYSSLLPHILSMAEILGITKRLTTMVLCFVAQSVLGLLIHLQQWIFSTWKRAVICKASARHLAQQLATAGRKGSWSRVPPDVGNSKTRFTTVRRSPYSILYFFWKQWKSIGDLSFQILKRTTESKSNNPNRRPVTRYVTARVIQSGTTLTSTRL